MKRRVSLYLLPVFCLASVVGAGFSTWYFLSENRSSVGLSVDITYLSTVKNYDIQYQGTTTELIFDQTEEGRNLAMGGRVPDGASEALGIHFHVDEKEATGIEISLFTKERDSWQDIPVALAYEISLTGMEDLAKVGHPGGYIDNRGNVWHGMHDVPSGACVDWSTAVEVQRENSQTGELETWYRVEVPFNAATCSLAYVNEPKDETEYAAFEQKLQGASCSMSFTLVELH